MTRHQNRIVGWLTREEAAVRALDTSGRAGLFAGGTVVVALLGLLMLDVSVLSGLGIGASITVAWSVAAAITLLPAMLGLLRSCTGSGPLDLPLKPAAVDGAKAVARPL